MIGSLSEGWTGQAFMPGCSLLGAFEDVRQHQRFRPRFLFGALSGHSQCDWCRAKLGLAAEHGFFVKTTKERGVGAAVHKRRHRLCLEGDGWTDPGGLQGLHRRHLHREQRVGPRLALPECRSRLWFLAGGLTLPRNSVLILQLNLHRPGAL